MLQWELIEVNPFSSCTPTQTHSRMRSRGSEIFRQVDFRVYYKEFKTNYVYKNKL